MEQLLCVPVFHLVIMLSVTKTVQYQILNPSFKGKVRTQSLKGYTALCQFSTPKIINEHHCLHSFFRKAVQIEFN